MYANDLQILEKLHFSFPFQYYIPPETPVQSTF